MSDPDHKRAEEVARSLLAHLEGFSSGGVSFSVDSVEMGHADAKTLSEAYLAMRQQFTDGVMLERAAVLDYLQRFADSTDDKELEQVYRNLQTAIAALRHHVTTGGLDS